VTTIPAFLIVLGCLYMVLRPRRPKPKINWGFRRSLWVLIRFLQGFCVSTRVYRNDLQLVYT
jgi:hypothetical protein